uniref:Uncharacterized protein n=1 Tax=Eptatretus burgeri TaxID=7764 RepID=A0A8C4Q029_EPTBU
MKRSLDGDLTDVPEELDSSSAPGDVTLEAKEPCAANLAVLSSTESEKEKARKSQEATKESQFRKNQLKHKDSVHQMFTYVALYHYVPQDAGDLEIR